MKYLIINADDFGYSKLFNQKILELLERGLLTSTSVMIDWIDEVQGRQVRRLKEITKSSDISVGLHTEFKNEDFKEQIQEQFKKFTTIFGFEPHYIDIHKSTYLDNGYLAIMQFCVEKNIPCKNHNLVGPKVMTTDGTTFKATGEDFESITRWLGSLVDNKTYLIQFHPGIYDPESKSSFNEIREVDASYIEMLPAVLKQFNIQPIDFKYLKEQYLQTHGNKR